MKANPGGTITGEAILGRETEIEDIWEIQDYLKNVNLIFQRVFH